MAKYREEICKYYICKGMCEKDKEASHKGICQHCTKYKPRANNKHINKKKEKIRGMRAQCNFIED